MVGEGGRLGTAKNLHGGVSGKTQNGSKGNFNSTIPDHLRKRRLEQRTRKQGGKHRVDRAARAPYRVTPSATRPVGGPGRGPLEAQSPADPATRRGERGARTARSRGGEVVGLFPAPRRAVGRAAGPQARGARRLRGAQGARDAGTHSPPGRSAPRAGPGPRRRSGGRGRRCCRQRGGGPSPGYESAAGCAPRGGSYGKAAGEGRGPETFAISRPAAHSWRPWDPQEFASFWSPGKRTGPRGGAAPGLGQAGGGGGGKERKWERPGEEK